MKDKSGYIQIEPKMGDSDEGICGLGCWAKKVLSKAGNYILGAGKTPKGERLVPGKLGGQVKLKIGGPGTSGPDALAAIDADVEADVEEAILKTLKSGKDISMMRNNTHELVFHGLQTENDKQVRWSIRERLVFYRDDQKRLRRFDTDKAKNKRLRK